MRFAFLFFFLFFFLLFLFFFRWREDEERKKYDLKYKAYIGGFENVFFVKVLCALFIS